VRTILLLAANPIETASLRLGEEFKRIEAVRRLSSKRDEFRLVKLEATSDEDLRNALLEERPEIVHFSGHGIGRQGVASARDIVVADDSSQGGLAFEDEMGHLLQVRGDSLGGLLRHFSNDVKCVVLNACFSDSQAKAIARHIDYVIGMSKAIGDLAAITFAKGFYSAIVAGRSYECAFDLGCNAIELKGIPEHQTPVLTKRQGATAAPRPARPPAPTRVGVAPDQESTRRTVAAQPEALDWDPRILQRAERKLARFLVTALAERVVRDAAPQASSLEELYRFCADAIPTEEDRVQFIQSLLC
jgi:CHAT domain